MTSRATTRSTAAAADATIKDEIIAETMKGVSDIVARQGLSGNSMPPIFTGDNMDAVEWMDIFELYASAGKWDDETKILKMNISMRARGIRWLKSATQPDDTWVNRKSSFIKYFKPADLLEHAEFVACQQNEEEPTQLYIERYLKLADQIKTTMDESEKVNRLIFGLLPHVRDLILIHAPKTIQAVRDLCEASEVGRILSQVDIRGGIATISNLERIQARGAIKSNMNTRTQKPDHFKQIDEKLDTVVNAVSENTLSVTNLSTTLRDTFLRRYQNREQPFRQTPNNNYNNSNNSNNYNNNNNK